jgi:hypothetical protein
MLRRSTHQDAYFVKKNLFAAASFLALGSFVFNSCDTPVGQGAGWGLRLAQSSAEPLLVRFVARLLALLQVPQPAR